MNRILLLCFFSVLTCVDSSAQTKTTKDILLDTICSCVTTKKAELKNASTEDLQKAIETCFISNGIDLLLKYAKEQNVDFSDEDAMQKLGMGLGMELIKMCPAVMELSLDAANKKDPSSKTDAIKITPKISKGDVEGLEAEGTIVAVHTTTFPASIEIKQANGSIKKLYIVSEFITADDKLNNPANLTGKKIKAGYAKQKIFMPASKKFEELEIILSLNHP